MFMNPFQGSCTCTHHFSPVGYWGPTNSTPLLHRNNIEAEKLNSISEIPECKDKSHEELRSEDKANGQSSRRPSLFPSAFERERNNNYASVPNLCRCGQNCVFGTEPLSTTTGASSAQTFKNTKPPSEHLLHLAHHHQLLVSGCLFPLVCHVSRPLTLLAHQLLVLQALRSLV